MHYICLLHTIKTIKHPHYLVIKCKVRSYIGICVPICQFAWFAKNWLTVKFRLNCIYSSALLMMFAAQDIAQRASAD